MVRQYKSMQAQSNTQVAQLENELRLTKERLGIHYYDFALSTSISGCIEYGSTKD